MHGNAIVTDESIALVRGALGKVESPEDLIKSWSQPGTFNVGIQNIDLEAPAKSLFPVLTPLRNEISRVDASGGIQANWKAITGINTANLDIGVSDGNRGGAVTTTTEDYFAAYRQLGLEDYVTWGAEFSADKFLDLYARAQTNLLWATMIAEEIVDLGGNTSLALGTAPQPTVADVGTGGTLNYNTTYSVIVAALTLQGYRTASIAGGVRGQVSRSNIDGTTDQYGGGTSQVSTNRTVTTANDSNATHSLTASCAAVEGAFGYAWFWGTAGSEKLGAITTLNSVVITAAAAGTQTASSLGAADWSTNSLVYDGILTQICKTGAGYYAALATGTAGTGTPLTADDVGGVVEIDAALQWFWDNYRLSPDTMWVSSQQQRDITKKVLSGSSTGAQRFMINVNQGDVKGGDLVTSYLNKFGMNGVAAALPIRLHPNMPPGTIAFTSKSVPYPLANIPGVLVKRLRQDYFATQWPMTKRRREYGVYFDGVLQNYFPPAFGVITNIGNG